MYDEVNSNSINNEFQPGEFYLANKAPLQDPRFDNNGVDGFRAFRLLQIMQDLSTIPGWKFYQGDLANRLGVSVRTLHRATRLLKEWGYLSISPVVYHRQQGTREIQKVEYVWTLHRVTVEDLRSRGILPEIPTVDTGGMTRVGIPPVTEVGIDNKNKKNKKKDTNKNIMATALPQDRVNKTIGWIATNIFGEANYKGEFQWEELEEVQEWIGRVLAESRYKETLVELERLAAEGLTFKEAIGEFLEPR